MKLTLPPFLLFNYWGSAPCPWLLILSSVHADNAALIAHEQCHQAQQRKDGLLTFWFRYLTNKEARLAYEVEAYKVWVQVEPTDKFRVVHWLINNYGLELNHEQALALLD